MYGNASYIHVYSIKRGYFVVKGRDVGGDKKLKVSETIKGLKNLKKFWQTD